MSMPILSISAGKHKYIICLAVILFLFIAFMQKRSLMSTKLLVEANLPVTSDPVEFDNLANHFVFPAVLSTLVTDSFKGSTTGIIAESWTTDQKLDEWSFKIRENIYFSNGDLITPNAVLKCFHRLIHEFKKRESRYHAFVDLKGFDEYEKLGDEIDGIKVEGNVLRLSFNKAKPNLLEDLGFGLYSVAHESNWDPITGAWIADIDETVSSGFYEIVSSSEETISIALREDFLPNLRLSSAFDKIEFQSRDKIKKTEPAVVFGKIINGHATSKLQNHEFFSPFNSADMMFARVMSHTKHPILSDPNNRRILRNLTYKRMGIQPGERTFIPAFFLKDPKFLMSAYEESSEHSKPLTGYDLKLTYKKTGTPVDKFYPYLEEAAVELGAKVTWVEGVKYSDLFDELNPGTENHTVDIYTWVSGLGHSDPNEVLKFMVMSGEGIRLPDPSGELADLVGTQNFSREKFEEILHRDAAIWPLGTVSVGFFYDKDVVSFSDLNASTMSINWAFISTN